MSLNARVGITIDRWHLEMHCKYSKCNIQNSYRFTSADATAPVGMSAPNKWLRWFLFRCAYRKYGVVVRGGMTLSESGTALKSFGSLVLASLKTIMEAMLPQR